MATESAIDIARRLQRRAEAFRGRAVPDQTEEAMAVLRAANEEDWALLRENPRLRLAVCRELLRGYWDLSRLR